MSALPWPFSFHRYPLHLGGVVWGGGISKLSAVCAAMFGALLLFVLLAGGEARYILETGVQSLGNLAQNFLALATWIDPLRLSGGGGTGFAQSWTVFYWSYWMVWCIATPLFIGTISKGRTIRSTVLGGYFWGLAGTFASFIILGNFGLAKQMRGSLDAAGRLVGGGTCCADFGDFPAPASGRCWLSVGGGEHGIFLHHCFRRPNPGAFHLLL